jgi:hypothetical protein
MSAQEQKTERKPSWRDWYDVHPAAAFYHEFSTTEQLEELADDIEKQQLILDPIHTASVLGARKPFVIDGVSRLDGAEARGFQIIKPPNGEWTGMLGSATGINRNVVHHPRQTDEQVWDIVHSLNNKRRHLTESQRSLVAAKRVDLREQAAAQKSYSSIEGKLSKRGRPEGRPSKGITRAEQEEAEKMNVSVGSVQRARRVMKEAPEKVADIMRGAKRLGPAEREIKSEQPKPRKPKTKPKEEKPFEDQVWKKWGSGFMQLYTPQERKQVRKIIHPFAGFMSEHWPQSERELKIIRSFITFMARNWPYGKREPGCAGTHSRVDREKGKRRHN